MKSASSCLKLVLSTLAFTLGSVALLSLPDGLMAQTTTKPKPQSLSETFATVKNKALTGDAHAEATLGAMYLKGLGVQKDYAEGLAWERKSADQGNAIGENDLGEIYLNGWGVSKDYAMARTWFQKRPTRPSQPRR